MKVTSAILADFVQVREGLLFVSSGGITVLFRPELPASLGLDLGVVLELEPRDLGTPHEMRIAIAHVDTAEVCASMTGAFQAGDDAATETGVPVVIPLPLSLKQVLVEKHGVYDLKISLDGEHAAMLTFTVVPDQPPAIHG